MRGRVLWADNESSIQSASPFIGTLAASVGQAWTEAIVCVLSWHGKLRFDNLAIHQNHQSFLDQKGTAGQDRIRYATGQYEPCSRRHVQ
jgi:hypothetical protein